MNALLPLAALLLAADPAAAPTALRDLPGLGEIRVRAPQRPPSDVVVLLTGAGGWDAAAEELARALAARGGLVLGVDTPAYLKRHEGARCIYPAGDLEAVAQHAEKELGLATYRRPVLVGHSRGAAVAWAALAGGPTGTFRGAVLAGTCPQRPLPKLCRGGGTGPAPVAVPGGFAVPGGKVGSPVALISGAEDPTCPARDAEAFAAKVPGATFVALPGLGHAVEPAAPWADAIAAAARKMDEAAAPPAPARAAPQGVPDVKDLPIVEVPTQAPGKRFAIFVSGDGGWVGLDRGVSSALAEAGVPVVGLDSLRYFWRKKSPDQTAKDVARLVEHYRAVWGRDEVMLVGYSRGADIVPFLPARMPEQARESVKLVAMLAPGTFAEFEVHVIDLFSSVKRSDATSTEQAVRTLGAIPALCVRGAEEDDSLCPHVTDLSTVKEVVLPGAHHFDRDWPALAKLILDAAPAR